MNREEFEKQWKEIKNKVKYNNVEVVYGNNYVVHPDSYSIVGNTVFLKLFYSTFEIELGNIKELRSSI
jgi:hydrogenase maturation factor